MSQPKRILVAMSGGVDSSVAAALLRERGHELVGVFMRNGVAAVEGRRLGQGCCSVEDARDAQRVADQLDIPFQALDLSEGFEGLIDDFLSSYAVGETPNPCIECNRRFKMGALRRLAKDLGATQVASGHYARIIHSGGRYAVEEAVDSSKDQSYVLYSLDQEALAETLFPLGDLTKEQVRMEARRLGLRVAEKAESMDICFVPSGDYRDLLRERRPDLLTEGVILGPGDREIGTHPGTAFFTIGQRRGLPGGQASPLYVTGLDPKARLVRVGPAEDLFGRCFQIDSLVWSGLAPREAGERFSAAIKIRSQHAPASGSVEVLEGGALRVTMDTPQRSLTPGQAAVAYRDGRILVGGTISQVGAPV